MANLKEGTSSEATQALGREYEVFLNFRGEDTRYNFTDFLYDRLVDAGVHVFRDEEKLPIGDVISEKLVCAINSSILYIPIFSLTYAFSIWCLRELALMVDNVSKSEGQKSILPIFLHVEPKDVKLKTPLYCAAFEKHKEDFPNEVDGWKRALEEVDEIKGWKVRKDQGQAATVKLVVQRVLEKLDIKKKSVTEHLVGLDDRVNHLRELLDVNQCDVRLIGIYGMGGVGKTTIAKVIFNQLSSHFGKRCSFLEDIRCSSLTKEGIVQLQKKLLSDIVDSESAEKIKDSEEGMRRIGETLPTEKVLVVLDDVDNKENIKTLIGNSSLHSGSRIIITTRNMTTLQAEGLKGKILLYEMLKMDYGLALQLFCRHAFGRDFPLCGYHRLSSEIVSSMGGLPLAIQVIGSLLYRKDKAFWKETLVKSRNVPEKEILKKLRISYDDLDEHQQQIFLDIACFFFNEKKTDAIHMWADCDFYPIRGIEVLIERCLIKILDNDKFGMHDQLIDLGRQIVRQESLCNLRKQSRLWNASEALEIIRTEERKDEVQALQICGLHDSTEITNEEFKRLPNLRFLNLGNGTFSGDFAKCHSKLRWISWHPLALDFRADSMHLDRLVVFKLGMNFFTDDSKAWDLIKMARNLKFLSLTDCNGITAIPDFSQCLGLERLTLARCDRLKRIESFIGNLRSLIELEIKECMGLTDLPEDVGTLVKLKHLSLGGCSRLSRLPGSLGNLTSLIELDLTGTSIAKLPNSIKGLVKLESFIMRGTKIGELPNSIGKLKSLRVLSLSKCKTSSYQVWQLPSGISMLENLEELDFSGCTTMEGELPDGIRELSSLRILNLERTGICGIPRTINMLHHLQTLNLSRCHVIRELPELPKSLTCLLLESKSLLLVPNLSNLTNLVELLLSDGLRIARKSNEIAGCDLRWIGRLSKLKKLNLNLPDVPAPPELASLSHLEELTLCRLDLETLVQLPSSLLRLKLQSFSIRRAGLLLSCLKLRNLWSLEFCHGEVEDIPLDGLPQLENLNVNDCKLLQRLSIPLELRNLRQVLVSYCLELVEIQVMGLSKLLDSFFVFCCESLRRIVGLSHLKNLEQLTIQQCNLLANIEGLHELPDDCLVQILECGDFIKDSSPSYPYGISLKRYREEILLNSSNKMEHLFTIRFHLGEKKSSEGFEFVGGIKGAKEYVTSDSVTYKGLITDVKGLGFRVKRMWYMIHGLRHNLHIEIESDEQVKRMVRLASNRRLIDLYVEGEADSELGNAECSEATANRRQMNDGRIGQDGNADGRKTGCMERRKKDKDETGERANQNDFVPSSCQRCKGVEHYGRSCIATTKVEDQTELSSVKSTSATQGKRQREDDHASHTHTATDNSTCGQQSGIPQHVTGRTRRQAAKIPPVEAATLPVEVAGPSRKKKRTDRKQVNSIRSAQLQGEQTSCTKIDSHLEGCLTRLWDQ